MFTLFLAGALALGCTTSEDVTPGGGSGGHGSGGTLGGSGTGGATGSGGSGTGGMIGTGGAGSGGSMDAGRETGGDTASDGGGGDASGPATFTELWNTIFSQTVAAFPASCAGTGCHSPTTSGGVNMSTKAMAYTGLRTKVTPGNPATSGLVTRLESNDATRAMPRNRPALSAELKLRVRSWIMNGAKND